ncbi:HLA class II histocompatibility antigen, DRB1 beta chain-like isoform X2 [Rhineura floridana]|uniref:HLA class II histocompatibility antigen, DRB1 beta chain-like isoform X2 n=1 Tax=Rhineura floridana TaxID=261503 RepID=UPI002AC84FA2|nr:HLA class II histocompatibility antigen, DRB1 beta chain-like isoform X2 [Rhineura floridana]
MVGTCALDLGVLLGAAVLVVLVSPPEVLGVEEPPEHFLFQSKGECHYSVAPNGTLQRVRYLDRYFWDRQELARFDSDIGTYVAVGELGEIDAQKWNRDKDRLRSARDDVECFCRHNYGNFAPFASARRDRDQVVQEWGGGDQSVDHRPHPEWGLDLPDPGDVGGAAGTWRCLHLPGGARQLRGPHHRAMGGAVRLRQEQDVDGDCGAGAGAGLCGARTLPLHEEQERW